jgi:hypothetical protein
VTAPGWEGVLEPGERVLWQGQPDGALHFDGFEIGQTVFGVAFAGFALFFLWQGMGAVADGPQGILFPLVALVFLGVGANLAGGRYFLDCWKRRNTHYSLTTRRAFIATNLFGWRRLREWRIDASTKVDLLPGPWPSLGFTGSRTAPGAARASFDYLEDARAVQALMRSVQAGTA